MVQICNILTSNGLISMDCYIDGCQDEWFQLVLNASNFSVERTSLVYPNTYAMQVIDRIKELRKKGTIPKEAISMIA